MVEDVFALAEDAELYRQQRNEARAALTTLREAAMSLLVSLDAYAWTNYSIANVSPDMNVAVGLDVMNQRRERLRSLSSSPHPTDNQ